MNQKTKALCIWIDSALPLEESIAFFEKLMSAESGKKFNKLILGGTDKSQKNWKILSRSFNNSPNGLNRLGLFLNEKEKLLSGLSYEWVKLLDDFKYQAVDIDIAIDYSTGDSNELHFFFNENENPNINLISILTGTYNFLKRKNISIKYGFSLIMENKKMPTFFCSGYGTGTLKEGNGYLNDQEEDIVSEIANKDIQKLITRPFDIQIINKDYIDLSDTNIKKLRRNRVLIESNEDIFIFTLPVGADL
jgi:hypothetical protein